MSQFNPTRKPRSQKPRHPASARRHKRTAPHGTARESFPPRTRIDVEAACAANPRFAELGVRPECLELLTMQSIAEPTPIQSRAIQPALEGRDLVAIAQTGTGKTLAFGLPLLARLAELKSSQATALILSPTRELAQQIHDVIQPLARALRLHATCVYGGVGMERQSHELRSGGGVIIATPGRLLDHMNRRNTDFTNLTTLVLDEADRMLDMGFLPDIRRIIAQLPAERQTLMFSATFPEEIARLTHDMQEDPLRIEIAPSATPSESVRQCIYTVDSEAKHDLLADLLRTNAVRSAIIFVRTRRRADRVAHALKRDGFRADAIHGLRTQHQRRQAIEAFTCGKVQYLVATDVAARGIDVSGISHVINYDIPATPDDYVHRIGRTARAHADGDAITFITQHEARGLRSIEESLGKSLDRVEWAGAVSLNNSRAVRNAGAKPKASGKHPTRTGSWAGAGHGKFKAKKSAAARHTWKPKSKRRAANVS